MRYIQKYRYAAIIAAAVFLVLRPPYMTSFAAETSAEAETETETTKAAKEEPVLISTCQELKSWYEKADKGPVSLKLSSDLIVNIPLELGQKRYKVEIITGEPVDKTKQTQAPPQAFSIRIVAGGKLTLDHPLLTITGPGPLIVAEEKGELLAVRGTLETSDKAGTAIQIKKGGLYSRIGKELQVTGLVMDENSEEPTKPTEPPVTAPETTPEAVKPSEEVFCVLTADLISVDKQIAEIRLSVPELPHNTEEVYIYYSKNQEKWEKVYWLDDEVAGDPKEVKNFVTEIQKVPPYTYIPYEHIFEEYGWQDKIYLKVQVIGPSRTGMSTVVEVDLKEGPVSESGSSLGGGHLGNNYSGGGSYGGGGYSGYGGLFGGGSGGSASDSSGAGEEKNKLPVIFLSRSSPYWEAARQAASAASAAPETKQEEAASLPSIPESGQEGENPPEESSPFEESLVTGGQEMQQNQVVWEDNGAGQPMSGQEAVEEGKKGGWAAAGILVLILAAVGIVICVRKKKK